MSGDVATGTPGNDRIGAELPPHPPANVMDLYMTEYDYDFNREPGALGASSTNGHGGDTDAWISGDVRNRPPFAHNVGALDGDTTYRTYHDAKVRTVNMSSLAHDAQRGLIGDGTSFMRDYYRPDLTANVDGEAAPISTYRAAHNNQGRVPEGENTLYAGAKAATYDPEFLSRGVSGDVVGGDIPPNITDRASLLPRHPALAASGAAPGAGARKDAPPPAHTSTFDPNRGPGEYTCTSWEIGDTSKAYPSQLPQGLLGSTNAHLLDTSETDKAALLRKLAGVQPPKKATPHPIEDDTNPILLTRRDQDKCAVSRRLDDEGHVKMTMYQSEHVNQYRLPELPGNHPEQHPGNTRTDPSATAGERMDGTLTRELRRDGTLRNSHGYLQPQVPASLQGTVGQGMLDTMRADEKITAVDRADPHRRKLH